MLHGRTLTALLGLAALLALSTAAGCGSTAGGGEDGPAGSPSSSAPDIRTAASSLEFGQVLMGTSSTARVAIENTGGGVLAVRGIALEASSDPSFQIVSGPVSADIAPGASVTVQIAYSPSEVGTHTGALRIESDDAEDPVISVTLSGTGTALPAPEIDPSPLALDFDAVTLGSSRTLAVAVSNTGSADLDLTGAAFGPGSSGEFSLASNPVPATVAPGASVTLQVAFTPAATGTATGTLRITSDDADEPVTAVSLSGTGTAIPASEIDASPAALDFGAVTLGSSRSLTVAVSNTGSADLDLTGAAFGPGSSGEFSLASNPAPATVAPGASVSFTVAFRPAATGTATGTLRITSDDADEPVTAVSLSGTGTALLAPEIDISPLALDFGAVTLGSSRSLTVAVTNTGSADLDLTGAAFGPGSSGEFSLPSNPAPATVAPGASVSLQVDFTPAATGTATGTLRITSDDADEPVTAVSLSGTGTALPVPEIDISPLALDFGDVTLGSSRSLTVAVTNTGSADLDLTGAAFGPGSSGEFALASSPAPATVAPGASVTLQVAFSPAATGTATGTLRITSDDADEPVTAVSLSGTGTALPAPEIDISPLALDFGDVITASSVTLSVTVRNLGTAVLDLTGVSVQGSSDFTLSDPGSSSVAAGGSTTVEVTFMPSGEGTRSGTLAVASMDADEPSLSVSLGGTGVADPAAGTGLDARFVTFLGGSGEDFVRDVAFDTAGNVYVAGGTASSNFPATAGAYDPTYNGVHDAFAAKFSAAGQLLWATFIGGPNYDRAYALEVDAQGYVYVAGRAGVGFPTTPGALQRSFAGDSNPNARYGPQDGFVTKLSSDGSGVVWSTYFGASSNGILRDIAIDGAGNVYLPFVSDVSVPYVTPGAWQTARGGSYDGVVAKLAADGSRVVWASYIGGSGWDLYTPSVGVDAQGYVCVAGYTTSPDLPVTAGASDRTLGGRSDMHVAKFLPDGSGVVFSTYVGGSGSEFSETHCLALDGAGTIYLAATTTSTDLPVTAGAFQRSYGGGGGANGNYGGDGFVAKLSASGGLLAVTYLGGGSGEGLEGIGLDSAGNIYVGGASYSSNYPTTPDAYQPAPGGQADWVLSVLGNDLGSLLYSTRLGGSGEDYGRTLMVAPSGAVAIGGMTQSSSFPVLNAAQARRSAGNDGALGFFLGQ